MSTVTKDIGSLRLALAIGAAIIAVLLGIAVATGMGALLWSFHTLRLALRGPLAEVRHLAAGLRFGIAGERSPDSARGVIQLELMMRMRTRARQRRMELRFLTQPS